MENIIIYFLISFISILVPVYLVGAMLGKKDGGPKAVKYVVTMIGKIVVAIATLPVTITKGLWKAFEPPKPPP